MAVLIKTNVERMMIMKTSLAQALLERYERLILENYRLSTENHRLRAELEKSVPMQTIKDSFVIESNYEDGPMLRFDYRNFLNIIESLFTETKYVNEYKIKDVNSLYPEIIFGVFERIPEDDEDQA